MCLSTPKMPAAAPPPQEAKQPDTMAQRRRAKPAGMGGGTLLTSPSGVASSGLNLGGSTLLGG
jgi:hypothetical protein